MSIAGYEFQKPGKIVEYFPLTQTATIKICNDRTYSNSEESKVQKTPGLLYDVPVYTSGGGSWHLTFPIKEGDSCLLSFSQFGYDHWLWEDKDAAGFDENGNTQPWTDRKFDLADGFAQVGWNNIPTAVENYSPEDVELRNAASDQKLTLSDNTIKITSGATTITITKDGGIDIQAGSNVVGITAETLAITGNSTISGNLDVVGDINAANVIASTEVTAGAVTLTKHKHAAGTALISTKPGDPVAGITDVGVG